MFALLKTIRIFAPILKREAYGRLAQLVQSICLTSRGSAVRIRQRPLHLPLSFQNCNFRAFSSAGSEHLPYKQRVGGSNPSTPTENIFKRKRKTFGRLAQLVQSICLTSRGSAVRIRQRPQNIFKRKRKNFRAFSSAGSEHLPYKQRVGGSNPSTPTKNGFCIN